LVYSPFFEISVEGLVLSLPYFPRKTGTSKNDLHIRIPVGFPKSGWGKLDDEIHLASMAFGIHLMRGIPAVFRQKERYSGTLFSSLNRTVLRAFPDKGMANGA